MKLLYYPLILVFSFILSSCNGIGIRGSGIIKDEERTIEEFDELEINGYFDVYVICGEEPSLTISGDDNIIPLIQTEVSNGRLAIWNEKNFSLKRKLKIKITTETLEHLELSGASSVRIAGINNSDFNVDASGAVSVKLSGVTENLDLQLSGAVNVDASKLRAENVDADLSGASNATVYADNELTAGISGIGNIEYLGNQKQVSKRISGLGSITQK